MSVLIQAIWVETISNQETIDVEASSASPTPSKDPMEGYYRFQSQLLLVALTISIVACLGAWLKFSLTTALSYGIGSVAGLVYLRMLSRNVAQIGVESRDSSGGRLALVALVFLVALKLDQIEFLPVFFGFLTHKLALVGHTFWGTLLSD